MPDASRPGFLRHFGRRPPRPGADLADMGTAFALDHVLDPSDHGLRPASEAHAPKAVVPVASWRLWLGRKLGA